LNRLDEARAGAFEETENQKVVPITRNGSILTSEELQQNFNNREVWRGIFDGRGNLISLQHGFRESGKTQLRS
jgi:hypothetical protein